MGGGWVGDRARALRDVDCCESSQQRFEHETELTHKSVWQRSTSSQWAEQAEGCAGRCEWRQNIKHLGRDMDSKADRLSTQDELNTLRQTVRPKPRQGTLAIPPRP